MLRAPCLESLFAIVFIALLFTQVSVGQRSTSTAANVALNPAPLNMGTVQIGSSSVKAEQAANVGPTSVTVYGATVTGTGFALISPSLPVQLKPSATLSFKIRFTPQSGGQSPGRFSVHYGWQDTQHHWRSTTTRLFGTGRNASAHVTATPSPILFGTVQVKSRKSVTETIANSGGAALTISQISASGSEFTVSGINPPVTLSPGQSVSFSTTFAPLASGTASGTVAITSNAANPNVSVAMSGTGAMPGQLTLTPSSIDFGNVAVGTSLSRSVTLSATGGPVTVSSDTVNNAEFSVTGMSLPFTIPSSGTSSMSLVFTPHSSGATSGTVKLTSTATNSPTTDVLSGTGTAPPIHSVTLNWKASTSGGVVGYNIYRSTNSGGPYSSINSSLDPSTTETDANVTAGATYYYVVTAVNSSSQESAYSTEVKAVVPYP